MHTRGSVIAAASRIDADISPTPPLIFTGGQKVRLLALLLNTVRVSSHCGLETEQDIFTIFKLGV